MTSPVNAPPAEFRAQIARLGLSQLGAARLLGVDGRTVRRWAIGEREVPETVLRLLTACERHPDLVAELSD